MKLKRGKNIISALLAVVLLISAMSNSVFADKEPLFADDGAKILSDRFKADVERRSAILLERTGCQTAVVTVDFMGGEDIEDFSEKLFLENGIGEGEDKGLLLLFSVGEEHYRAVAGQGMDGIISERQLQELLDKNAEPYFAEGDFSAAVENSYYAVTELLEEHFGVSTDEGEYLLYKQELERQKLAAEKEKSRALYAFAAAAALSLLFFLRFAAAFCFSLRRRAAQRRRLF